VRAEGDAVRDQDRIIFESCRFKGLQLVLGRGEAAHYQQAVPFTGMTGTGASFAAALAAEEAEGVVSVADDGYQRSGWQIPLVSRARQGLGMGRGHVLLSSYLLAVGGRPLPAAAAPPPAGKAGASAARGEGASALEDGEVICGGDFVRFAHQEIIGHLIARGTCGWVGASIFTSIK